jgi:predicted ATPase
VATADGASVIKVLRQHAPSWLLQLPALLSPHEFQLLQQQAFGATREQMLRELAEAIEILVKDCPLILLLEDLHWGDVSTLDWLAYVARRRAAARLLILGTYRPVDAVMRHHPIRAVTQELRVHGQCEELALAYLSEAGVAAYLAQRLGQTSLSHDFIRTLHRRTNGNPLFLVTVVDELLRRGPQGSAGWERLSTGPEPVTVDIPESLRLLIDQQLAQLRPEERICLEAASVAGRDFSAAAVAASLDTTVEEVEAQYAAFARRGQFVRACGSEEWPDGTIAARYSFIHDLYHEFLYEQIPASRRARWHQQIGVRLEVGYGTRAREMAAELAAHFGRGRDYAKALQYLQYAGENALRRSAPQEAIQHLTDALALLNHLPETPAQVRQELRLQLALAPALWATKGYAAPELEQAYVRARQLCTQPADVPQLFAASYGLYAVYIYRAELAHASELGQHLLRIAEQHQDRTLLLGAHDIRSCALFHGGQFVQARAHTEAGVTLYAPDTHDALVALYGADAGISCYSWSALTLCVLGYLDQGRQRNGEALALARAVSHPFSLAYALLFAVYVHGWCREVEYGSSRVSVKKPGSYWPRSMVGSARGLTRLISRQPGRS